MMNQHTIFRHGDLLISKIDYIPRGIAKKAGNILAYGEVTGHQHKFGAGQVQLYGGDQIQYFEVRSEQASLVHDEHKPIEIPRGSYEVIREKQYNPFENSWSRVLD